MNGYVSQVPTQRLQPILPLPPFPEYTQRCDGHVSCCFHNITLLWKQGREQKPKQKN